MAEYEERVSKNEQEGIPDILTDIAESDSEKTGGGGGDDDDEDDDESTDPDESEESDETPELIADEIASEGSPPS